MVTAVRLGRNHLENLYLGCSGVLLYCITPVFSCSTHSISHSVVDTVEIPSDGEENIVLSTKWDLDEWISAGRKHHDVPAFVDKARSNLLKIPDHFAHKVGEKELLCKAVATLNTVRRKGRVNITLAEFHEDNWVAE
jgi:hypothetical protein